eukprot:CAMPEP_0177627352 /NCGR_PEP_ID=MMETSP0419_2-20121207/31156_1 /TAXON_ID=582737 /ORGANISM="Tetraselmis sp., Strain GSL018" /LENGTH=73 /DNA_ID=CAMNT_0019128497 /DNA_START=69 /DNA_END=287 /DNA_ORIENTATION=+
MSHRSAGIGRTPSTANNLEAPLRGVLQADETTLCRLLGTNELASAGDIAVVTDGLCSAAWRAGTAVMAWMCLE